MNVADHAWLVMLKTTSIMQQGTLLRNAQDAGTETKHVPSMYVVVLYMSLVTN